MLENEILISFLIVALVYVALRVAVIIVSPRPKLGLIDGKFAECNPVRCVCSDDASSKGYITPIAYQGSKEGAKETLVKAIQDYGRAKIIEDTGDYIYAEFKSLTWGFIDDVEFQFDDSKKEIRLRSSSRIGNNDSGENRKRIERIRIAFKGQNLNEITSIPVPSEMVPKKEINKVFGASLIASFLIPIAFVLDVLTNSSFEQVETTSVLIIVLLTVFSLTFTFIIPKLKQLKPMRIPTSIWVFVLGLYGVISGLYLLVIAAMLQFFMDFGFYNVIEMKQWEIAQKSAENQ